MREKNGCVGRGLALEGSFALSNLLLFVLPYLFPTIRKNFQAYNKIIFDSENMDDKINNDQVAIVLYRVTQEALNNIVKHAQAKKVKVKLYSQGNNIILTICGNGRGFDIEERLKKPKDWVYGG